jgi:hypothetical protein
VFESLLSVKLLLAGRENEFGSAIPASERSVLKGHKYFLGVPPFGNAT